MPFVYPRWIDRTTYTNLRRVAPRLYVGGQDAVFARKWPVIINMCFDDDRIDEMEEYGPYRETYDSTYTEHLPMEDGDGIERYALKTAAEVYREARAAGKDVLIHCQMGLSRSASVAYALLRTVAGLRHDEAKRRILTPGWDHRYPETVTLHSAMMWADDHDPRNRVSEDEVRSTLPPRSRR